MSYLKPTKSSLLKNEDKKGDLNTTEKIKSLT
jgi:hypothetical protein